VYLHAVEASLDSVARCLGVQLNIFFDLRNSEFTRNIVIEGDGAGRDEIKATFLLEDGRFGGASKGPKLEEYVRAVGVNGIRNLCGGRSVQTVEVRHRETQTAFQPAI
jgi:hypothetical protein